MKNNTYIIAEMACSHDGKVDLAKQIIDGAGKAGADAIQFQIWKLSESLVPSHADYDFCSTLELSQDQWGELVGYVREHYPEMEIIGCVEEPASVQFCEKVAIDAYKLHTSELSNPVMIDEVAKTGKRIDLSVGASTLDEIQKALTRIRSLSDADVWLMYGYQNFPTDPEKVNLDWLVTLKNLFGLRVGYQDHTDAESAGAFWLPAASTGMGIDVQEKHITHNRSRKGCDHQAALNPDEFARFVEMCKTLDCAKGEYRPRSFSADEQKYRKYAKKSLVANKDLLEGNVITGSDLVAMRANDLGLPPDEVEILLGRKLRKAVAKYELVTIKDTL
ncbi:N-acetylneuraminate synthase family protein [Verrucomicrobiaceae bacterium N1E253]|uniref:N-acetylneuraminate synthase family protein n=1 Tax=Oceaniferula marina TaxID=2748318 RepID=A0A851GE09_9BACT|nr:N-acetylneuraminate synthase family protein [Oceaniferula marina]NWK55162.1 N-acetylneuraminate synthase family protein [Oceaniferula marina]